MPAKPGQPFQPVIPGLGRGKQSVTSLVPQDRPVEESPQWNDRRRYTGPMAGQLVMGATDLSDQKQDRLNAYDKKSHNAGFMEVDEHGYVQEGEVTPLNDQRAGMPPAAHMYGTHGGMFADAEVFKQGQAHEVNKHWKSKPTVQFPTNALVHSTQPAEETEGEAEEATTDWSASLGEGRERIEEIKDDLHAGGKIQKPIWMVKTNGRHFQLDGHHRMVAAREAGLSHVPVKMWDLDAERAAAHPPAALAHAVTANPALAAHTDTKSRSALMRAGALNAR